MASEPVEAAEPEAAGETVNVAAESEPPATPSAASPAISTHSSTADLPAPGTGAGPNAAKVVDRVAPVDTKAVDQVSPVDYVPTPLHHPLQVVRGALASGVQALAVPERVEGLRLPSGTPLDVGANAFPPPAIPKAVPAGFHSDEPAGGPDNASIRQLLDFAGVESPLPLTPVVSTGSFPGAPGLSRADLGHVAAGPVDEPLADFAPLDGNGPPPPPHPAPGPPQNEAGGAGGTIFIPIAALLALLALAAPAIVRRLGEAPGLRPQTPFVCALERPG
jgi:hypothetical protein